MEKIDGTTMLAAGVAVALGVFYYLRAEQVVQVRINAAASAPLSNRITGNGSLQFLDPKRYANDRTAYSVNDAGWARQGQFGLERRDYIDPASGGHYPTYTDNAVNY